MLERTCVEGDSWGRGGFDWQGWKRFAKDPGLEELDQEDCASLVF